MSWVDQKLENIVKKSPRHRSRAQEGPFEGVVPLTMLRALLVRCHVAASIARHAGESVVT